MLLQQEVTSRTVRTPPWQQGRAGEVERTATKETKNQPNKQMGDKQSSVLSLSYLISPFLFEVIRDSVLDQCFLILSQLASTQWPPLDIGGV